MPEYIVEWTVRKQRRVHAEDEEDARETALQASDQEPEADEVLGVEDVDVTDPGRVP